MIVSLGLDHWINDLARNWDELVAIAEIAPSDLHLHQ
jgi:hypothetical protein